MNRSAVRVGSIVAALLAVAAFWAPPVLADDMPDVWMGSTRLPFDHAQLRGADIAVATGDAGFARLLARVGATLAYQPGQRYVLITLADRRTITLTVGDSRMTARGITTSLPFSPFAVGREVYVPLVPLARALYLAAVMDGDALVLQPQIGALDVASLDGSTNVSLHGAIPLVFHRVAASGGRLALAFTGVGSSLDASRFVGTPGLGRVDVTTTGPARAPTTTVTFGTPPGTQRVILGSPSSHDLTLAFAPAGRALRGADIPWQGAAASFAGMTTAQRSVPPPPPPVVQQSMGPQPSGVSAPATVTAVDLGANGDGANVRVSVSGGVDFEWHRLNDNRWYVDLRGATLGMAPRDETPNIGGVDGLRVRQFALSPVPVVRVSLSLGSPRHVDVVPGSDGVSITVAATDDVAAARSGSGHIGPGTAYAVVQPQPRQTPWKFGPGSASQGQPPPLPATPPAAPNPRLIVLDPGHGGSDAGAMHNGVVEKEVTLDIARRLRSVLIARGWLVRMTRDTDVDVYAPNDSARDELQARCDVANNAGARMFVSIHANSFTTSSLSGTTTYYYKGIDYALAEAVHRHLIDQLGTRDDGVRKENFYVIHHTTMPAILVETAFLSNPGDAALLRSDSFLQHVAVAIADGVADYARSGGSQQTSDGGR